MYQQKKTNVGKEKYNESNCKDRVNNEKNARMKKWEKIKKMKNTLYMKKKKNHAVAYMSHFTRKKSFSLMFLEDLDTGDFSLFCCFLLPVVFKIRDRYVLSKMKAKWA